MTDQTPPKAAQLPLTRNAVSAARQQAIRAAVRAAVSLPAAGADLAPSRLATHDDVAALTAFLSLPEIYLPIYTLPRPVTEAVVADLIASNLSAKAAGEGLLFIRVGDDGRVVGFSEVKVWPEWGAGELGGALHPDVQSQGAGAKGAVMTFGWMFDVLGLDLICETGALDNIRTARLLDHLGFERKGEILSKRPDGSTRPSRVWEITRAVWRDLHGTKKART